ncbi:hypothetical protein [Gloeobacter kilaueensis]|uniref:Uncharacterized protein n=1 Tax=Gloeobacter kilaueensis (strain ATCC BAA-2537 / CCAP 1431/1 / ULC 316 / JS1) TaxID=1183438 RepID=U5QBW0_GLOK1|nr:hypothetical protein [Gloeobacter kilaueensis]AGY56377.1 hypothetical protein GKIL_0130 [Gloeobacter kilaueensis JS1]
MKSSICDQISSARDCGVVHCGILESDAITVGELAARFGLISTPDIYRLINRAQALAVAKRILHRDLAYDAKIMSEARAQALAENFLNHFDKEHVQYFTNGDYDIDSSSNGWNPATSATFDTGILVLGNSKAGCLWVEDED